MSNGNAAPPKTRSPLFSLLSRKKRINGAKSATIDIESSAIPCRKKGVAVTNGFVEPETSEHSATMPETSWACETSEKLKGGHMIQKRNGSADLQPQSSPTETNMCFADRVRYHKNTRKNKRNDDAKALTATSFMPLLSSYSNTFPSSASNTKQSMMNEHKAQSVDTVYGYDDSSSYLMEALETLADNQPIVARSIPKHAQIDTTRFAKHSLDNCLFDETVYNTMLNDSIKVCELLQDHLNECVMTVRNGTPDGRLSVLAEESGDEDESETTYDHSSQQTIIQGIKNSNRLSVLTNDTLSSSVEGSFEDQYEQIGQNVQKESRHRQKVQFKEL